MLEYNYHVLAEVEVIFELYDAIIAFVVSALVLVLFVQLREEFDFNIGIINIELFVLANLCSDNTLHRIPVVDALDHLSKGALVDDFSDEVAVAQLFTNFCIIKPVFVGNGVLVFPPNITDGVNPQVVAKFDFFEFSQLMAEHFECFLWAPTVERLIISNKSTLPTGSFCLR